MEVRVILNTLVMQVTVLLAPGGITIQLLKKRFSVLMTVHDWRSEEVAESTITH